ncbi:bifunctional ADP-dependent NAD(P)H-hydrate dehydratase/NAD(P)H-hydrate epimerase [Xylella fastidiosa]|uniref:bifunctional ADP-dependent NAD(P)H-hydrate dehydratase/NAD(P)H-hydrate epimerase n=1 Tax=Xylella fastidiosa TaxID=2371 RepID=UPI00005CDAAB|nr:bifunctional ADP-dependent NAD(P)H-hydrate dehydratase/NAD(P)H-hydrate epimerase [Xylella fastidiosa]ALQ94322.1 carbohydrate kinase [Xylella fastidiosa]ALQ97824.1 bifunctional ADP-dependent NAD(P)H-hydrate dehydratase/NAD(P)H-hydrate epimerase [Xylella fastidiosa]ALR02703.1 carbohydrate kinase [Xylella fastidiosa]ALR05027.1 bifunctional ADP-dependent NAD(P)H-hydrate dehydratase/NAD(P)H-hydrate epimerase [Xylella fastidiosa]ETE29819.1 carbohydrate kinase [Xylella fastidiosa 32]
MSAPFALYDTAAAAALDARLAAHLGDDGDLLMQRAGRAAWDLLRQRWPDARQVLVACGTGNNGGDGYVLACLAHRAGWQVQVVHLPGRGPASLLAQRAYDAYLAAGGQVMLFSGGLETADVLVDALFGIGLNRPLDVPTQGLINALNAAGRPVLALDVPSGVDAERGAVFGTPVYAHVTLQFIVPHVGLYTGPALEAVGERVLAALDVPPALRDALAPCAERWGSQRLASRFRPRRRNSHKGEFGRVLCVGGNWGSGGAIMLSAEAALRSGAGVVHVATREAHVAPLLARCPETMPRGVAGSAELMPLLAAADVVALGPGLGQDPWGQALLAATLDSGCALVIDADALNVLAAAPRPLPPGAILTPHPGEAGRLLGCTTAQVQADRRAAAQALAARFAAVVVLKGAGSLIAAPGCLPCVIDAGNPGMAVAGMGDVLTGVIAALRAQGDSVFDAALFGALLHAAAGDLVARDGGERGLLPSDVLPVLRRLINPDPAL